MARNTSAKGSSGDHGVGSGISKPGSRGSSRGSTSTKEGLPPPQPRRSRRSRAKRTSASTGLDATVAGDEKSQESAGEALLDLGRALSGAPVGEGEGAARSASPAPRLSKRGAGRMNYAVLNGSSNRAAIAAAAAEVAAAEAAAAAPRETPPRANPAAGGPRRVRERRQSPRTIPRQAADILQQEEEEEEEEEKEEDDDDDDDEDEEEEDEEDDDDEYDEDPVKQDTTSRWTYSVEEKEANFQVLIGLKHVIHSKEFAFKNGRGNDHWYTRVAHLIVKKLAKNKKYMRAHKHDYQARYGRDQMARLRKWVSSQKTQHNTHVRKRGTGGSGGKLPPSEGGLVRYRRELFSTHAASNKKEHMREAFTSSSGKSLNLQKEGAGGAPASAGSGGSGSGGGAEEEQGGSEVKPSKGEGKAKGKGKGKGKGHSQGQGQGQGQGKGKGKGKGKEREDGDVRDLDMDAGDSRWLGTSSESESENLSLGGGMSDGSVEGGSGGEEVEEISPPAERKRKRKSGRFSPQDIAERLQKISDAKAERQEETLMKVAGVLVGGTGAGGSSRGVGGSSSSAPNADQRRIDLQERQHRISTLQQAWKDAEVANQKGYGSLEEEKEAHLAYQQAVKDV